MIKELEDMKGLLQTTATIQIKSLVKELDRIKKFHGVK